MALSPTAAQRRLIAAADPATGRLKGPPAQLAALVKRGLAFRHPRPPHDHFLTPAGHRVREAAPGPQAVAVAPEVPAAPDTGVGSPHGSAGRTPPRATRGPRGCGRCGAPGRACWSCAG